MTTALHRGQWILWVGALLVFSGSAWGQDNQADLARSDLISRAEAARRAGNHSEALENATRAAQIRTTTSLRLLLAREHSSVGHVLEALGQATACVREVEADAGLRNRAAIQGGCQAIVTELEPRVGRLTVRVGPPAPSGLRVTVGGAELGATLIGVPYPVMPGTLAVHAAATGYRVFDGSVDIRTGQSGEIVVQMERDLTSPVTPPTITSGSTGEVDSTAAPLLRGSVQDERTGPGAGPWVILGIGSALFVAGGVLLWVSDQARQERNDTRCTDNACAMLNLYNSAQDRAVNYNYAGWTAIGLGGALAVSGLIWRLAAPPSSRPGRSSTIAVLPTSTSLIVGVQGYLQ